MDRFWIQRNDNSNFRIQAMVTNILLNHVIHITPDKEPIFNVPYTILLDDSQSQAERYALFIMDKLNLIELLFPYTPPELIAAKTSAHIQRLDFFNENISFMGCWHLWDWALSPVCVLM